MSRHRSLIALALATFTLAGCSAGDGAPTKQSEYLAVTDQWVKAAPEGMTAAFGNLSNDSDQNLRIVSANSDVAGVTELHEVVDNVMQEKDGGFVIPADSTFTLKPGAEHIMLMELKRPIAAGDQVTFQLTFADGSQKTVKAAARDFAGAQEDYSPH